MKLDLSKFKKIQMDQASTMLRSSDGHEIRIAHSGLSDKMRKELASLPLHAADGAMVAAPLDAESPAAAEGSTPTPADNAAMEGSTPTPADLAAMEGQTPAAEPSAESAPETPVSPPSGKPKVPPKPPADEIPIGGDVTVTGRRPPPPPPPTAQQHNAEDALFAQDLASGKITPETYQSLFAKKDTLGKLGTLFGLLVSGAGSGLTGQPNAVLHMMDRTLDRDLDAQKASNVNAQYWYQLSMQHELQQGATIPQAQATVAAQYGAAYEHAISGAFTEAKLKRLGSGAVNLNAAEAAKNRMMVAFGQGAQNHINKLPPGPGRQAAQTALDTQVMPAMGAQINANNTRRAARGAAAAAQNPAPQADTGAGHAINYELLNQMEHDADVNTSLGMPPAKGQVTKDVVSQIRKEATEVEDNRVAARAYDHAFKVLKNHWNKGALNESLYQAEINTLSAQIARETAGRFNLTEANQQVGGMFPSWKDLVSGAEKEKYNNTMNYFRGREAGTSTLNSYPKLKTPFPTFTSPFSEGHKWKEGETGTIKGKKVIFKNGKHEYLPQAAP